MEDAGGAVGAFADDASAEVVGPGNPLVICRDSYDVEQGACSRNRLRDGRGDMDDVDVRPPSGRVAITTSPGPAQLAAAAGTGVSGPQGSGLRGGRGWRSLPSPLPLSRSPSAEGSWERGATCKVLGAKTFRGMFLEAE